jgi:hypothetical protein
MAERDLGGRVFVHAGPVGPPMLLGPIHPRHQPRLKRTDIARNAAHAEAALQKLQEPSSKNQNWKLCPVLVAPPLEFGF